MNKIFDSFEACHSIDGEDLQYNVELEIFLYDGDESPDWEINYNESKVDLGDGKIVELGDAPQWVQDQAEKHVEDNTIPDYIDRQNNKEE